MNKVMRTQIKKIGIYFWFWWWFMLYLDNMKRRMKIEFFDIWNNLQKFFTKLSIFRKPMQYRIIVLFLSVFIHKVKSKLIIKYENKVRIILTTSLNNCYLIFYLLFQIGFWISYKSANAIVKWAAQTQLLAHLVI